MTTTPVHLSGLVDLTRLTGELRPADVLGVLDELLCLGPFGFRAAATSHVPDHLTVGDGTNRWIQVILPGYRCPSNAFLARCLHLCRTDHLHITSANRSRHATGAVEEPPHYPAAALRAELGGEPRLIVLEQDDEDAVQRLYPRHAPTSTTVLGLCAAVPGRAVTLERLGSLPVEEVRSVVEHHGIALVLPAGLRRLGVRAY